MHRSWQGKIESIHARVPLATWRSFGRSLCCWVFRRWVATGVIACSRLICKIFLKQDLVSHLLANPNSCLPTAWTVELIKGLWKTSGALGESVADDSCLRRVGNPQKEMGTRTTKAVCSVGLKLHSTWCYVAFAYIVYLWRGVMQPWGPAFYISCDVMRCLDIPSNDDVGFCSLDDLLYTRSLKLQNVRHE